jgi:acyl carrier protein
MAVKNANEIRAWLVGWIAREIRVEARQVEVDEPFVNLGLSSRQAVSLSGDLEDWLGVEVEPSAAWDHPSIAALSSHLARAAARD